MLKLIAAIISRGIILDYKFKKFYLTLLFFMLTYISIPRGVYFAERWRTLSTVSIVVERENNGQPEILLQLRKNTGWMDGFWELAACGHVENNETLKQAAIRETFEELTIKIDEKDLEFIWLNHNNIKDKGIYYCVYFKVINFIGTPKVGEPDKCEKIEWFPIDKLPENIIPIRKIFLKNYLNNIIYCENGWEK